MSGYALWRPIPPVMTGAPHEIRFNKRVMAYTAAAMYGAAALDGGIEGFLPGDPAFSIVPVLVVLVMFMALLAGGPRLPYCVLALLGPLGVALTSYALATTPAAGDGAVLYALPVLWTTLFYGRRGAIVILSCVAVGHAIVLLSLPSAFGYPGRWLDVMVAACSISLVVLALERRNQLLVARLVSEARTDSLTGLLNRRGFDERAAIELAHARRDGAPMALATFDLDYFKRINDEWGHELGDRVLARVGELLEQESRDIDVAARMGGEEFVVLLPGSDSEGAEAFTERVRVALAAGDPPDLPVVRVSAGILATRWPDDIQAMLQRADSALYEAKRSGRDQTVLYGEQDRGVQAARL
jgi:diguanylate cyclase (GGDEF)-like protein